MVVFGGHDGNSLQNDVWTLSLSGTPEWTRLTPSGTPPYPRAHQAAIYDPVRDRMVVFGGDDDSNTLYGDVWTLSLSGSPAWTQLYAGPSAPEGHIGATAIYDPVRDRMVVFGGWTRWGAGSYSSDVYAFSLSGNPTWTVLNPPAGTRPSTRAYHSAIYDPVRDRMVVFGGYGSESYNGMWTLSFSGSPAWTQLASSGTPPAASYRHSAIYDPVRDRMVVFAGDNYGTYPDDVSVLSLSDGTAWSHLAPTGSPPTGRYHHAAIHDPLRDRMVVFGGQEAVSASNEVWALTWSSPAPHFTIAATAANGGTIAPDGAVLVAGGHSQLFTITPDSCFVVADIIVDGASVGAVTSYAFLNVSNHHSIEARFRTAVQVASIAFDAQQYPAAADGLLHVTLQNDGLPITALVSPMIKPRYGVRIEPQPVSVVLQSAKSQIVTFPWTAPTMSGQSPVDATVTIEAAGCSIAPVTVLGRAVVSELTTHQREAAQQQLNDCGTTTGQSCDSPDPKELLVGLIPIWGTGVTAAKAAQNGCLAIDYWNQGRHAQSVAMWMATTANGVSAVGDAVDIASCVTGAGCAEIILSAPVDLALDLTSGLAVCVTHLLDLLSLASSLPTSSAGASNDVMTWLPDSLYESFRIAGDTLDVLAFASGPVTLRVMTNSVSTTPDTVAHTGAVVVPMPAQSMTYAALRSDLALLGRPDSTAGPSVLRVAAFEPGTSTFELMRRTPDGPVRVAYAPFDLDSGGTAAMTIESASTGPALRVDVDGDGRVDYIHFAGGVVLGVSAELPGDHPIVGGVQLSAAHPNPTSGGTTFVLRVGQAAFSGRLVIQDIAGRLVASLPVHSESPGEQKLYWPGTGNTGNKLGAGVYFAFIIGNGIRSHARSVIVVR